MGYQYVIHLSVIAVLRKAAKAMAYATGSEERVCVYGTCIRGD